MQQEAAKQGRYDQWTRKLPNKIKVIDQNFRQTTNEKLFTIINILLIRLNYYFFFRQHQIAFTFSQAHITWSFALN